MFIGTMSKIYKKKTSPYWWWTGRYKGKRYRRSLKVSKESYADKIKEYWDLQLMLDKTDFLNLPNEREALIKDSIWEHLKFLSKRKSDNAVKSAQATFNKFKHYCNKAKLERLDQITIKELNGFIEFLDCSAKTKKNHMGVIKRWLDQAVMEDILPKNPALYVTLPRVVPTDRHRLLTNEDLDIIFKDPEPWGSYYSFLLHTGLRAGDVSLLCRDNIDLERGCITSLVQKSRRTHEFPLSDRLRAHIPPDMKSRQPLFPQLYATNERQLNQNLSKPRKHMQQLLAAASRPKATLHSLRHTFNTKLRDLGMSIEDRRVLLSHATSSVTKIYTHPNLEVAKELINKL